MHNNNKFFIGVFVALMLCVSDANAYRTWLTITDITPPAPESGTASVDDLINALNNQTPAEAISVTKSHFNTTKRIRDIAYSDLAIDFVNQCKKLSGYAYVEYFSSRYNVECILPNAIRETQQNAYEWPQNIFSTKCKQINLNSYTGFKKQIADNMRSSMVVFSENNKKYWVAPCLLTFPNIIAQSVVENTSPLPADAVSTELADMRKKCEAYKSGNIKGIWVVNDFVNANAGSYSTAYQKAYCVFIDTSKNANDRTSAITASNAQYQSLLTNYIPQITQLNSNIDNWAYAPDNNKGLRCQSIFTGTQTCDDTITDKQVTTHVIKEWTEASTACLRKPEYAHLSYNGQAFPTGTSGNYTACEFSVNITAMNKK